MLVLQYLKNNSLISLDKEYGVCYRWDTLHTKFSLNYDQIRAKPGDKLAEECRGLILSPVNITTGDSDIIGECVVLARPFKRFYNLGDTNCANINIHSSVIYEKLDGTLTIVYYDSINKKWCVGTRSVPDADVVIYGQDITRDSLTFFELFCEGLLNTTNKSFSEWSSTLDKDCTHLFELTSQYNRVVVNYDTPTVTLLAVIENSTGAERDIQHYSSLLNTPVPKTYSTCDITALKTLVDSQNGLVFEGVVVCDKDYKRVKIKNTDYVLNHKTKHSSVWTPKNILNYIFLGKIDDIIPLLNVNTVNTIHDIHKRLIDVLQSLQKQYDDWNSQATLDKEFAFLVNQSETLISNVFFSARKHKIHSIEKTIIHLVNTNRFSDRSYENLMKYISS